MIGWVVASGLAPAQDVAAREAARQKRRTPVVAVFDACKDAVVNVSTTQRIQVRGGFDDLESLFGRNAFAFPGGDRTVETTSVGSGWVVHRSGYIVTNAHVVAQTAERKVVFSDGREFDAEIVGVDAENDLAVLKIVPDRALVELPLGRSDDLMVGETVIAIGNPLGLKHSVTSGVISATDRTLEVDKHPPFTGLIQTDASINPGNSGGPLLNILGELVGVNFAIRGDGQNIGFAIPVDRLATVLPSILDVERRYRFLAGMEVRPGGNPVLAAVTPQLPGAAAGLAAGDKLVTVGGQSVGKSIDYHVAMIGRKPGDRVSVVFERDGKKYQTEVSLAEKPKPDGAALAKTKLGLEFEPLDERLADELRLRKKNRLMVVAVEQGSFAERAGLKRGDILMAMEGAEISSLDDLGLLLETARTGKIVRVAIRRISERGIFQSITRFPVR
jgi:serine protease Do